MKNLMVFVRKEMLHILRDPKSLLIMILLPLIEILLFGFVLRFEINSANIAVYDIARQSQSTKLIHRLEAGKRFHVFVANSMPEAEKMMLSGKVKAILTIGADFDRVAELSKAPNPSANHTGANSTFVAELSKAPNSSANPTGANSAFVAELSKASNSSANPTGANSTFVAELSKAPNSSANPTGANSTFVAELSKAPNPQDSPLQLLLDASDPNLAATLDTYISATINDFWAENYANNTPPPLVVEPLLYYNPLLKSVYATIPGLISVVLMLICALMTSVSLTREKETGTMSVLLISPLKPMQIIIGKLIPYLMVSMVNVAIILTLAFTVFGMPMAGSIIMLILISLLYCICALALGFLISTKAKTQQLAMMVSLSGLMLPTTLLSGMIYPIQNMPSWLQGITLAIPARWYVSILKHIMIKGSPIGAYMMEVFVLIFITGIITALSLKNFKIRNR